MPRIVDRDLEALRETALRMGSLAEAIVAKSLRALATADPLLCKEVQEDDLEIDRLDVAIDAAVLELLATKAPVATDLRFVLATKSVATDLERVGDLARNIAKSAARLAAAPRIELPGKLDQLAGECTRLLRRALDCYADGDPERARRVLDQDDLIDASESRVIRDAIAEIAAHPELSSQEIDLILIAKNLERVADHATNIAEDVILIAEARNLKHREKLERAGDRRT
ncbi:MAG: phosphate signaling complex protein PhoU [Myxococcota bacterium]|nr:phosphate signaling complex protein PhoU [Myxococcales bacterium]